MKGHILMEISAIEINYQTECLLLQPTPRIDISTVHQSNAICTKPNNKNAMPELNLSMIEC